MAVLWFLAGGAIELVNAYLRKKSVLLANRDKRGRSVFIVVIGFVIRLVLTASIFALALQHNLKSGLVAFVGYWLSRWVWIWWMTKR